MLQSYRYVRGLISMRGAGIVAAAAVVSAGAAAAANAQSDSPTYTMTLRCDHPVPLNPMDVPAIYSWAREATIAAAVARKRPGPDP